MFVEDLERPVLDEADRSHLSRSLRLRSGDAMTLSDGAGRWRPGRFGPEVEADGEIVDANAPLPEVVVAFTPVKGSRPEWAVQKLTELGVDGIWLLVADRSVVRWEGGRATRHAERLARVAREAAMQARRCTLPALRTGLAVSEAPTGSAGAVLAHPGGGPPLLGAPVLIGPEGGWSEAELRRAGTTMGLGPTVLRAETAAVAAGTLLTALRSGVVGRATTEDPQH